VSAVLTAQEPSAKYLVNLQPPLVRHFDLIAQVPGGVARLRELILTLAVQGKLVPQDPSDEPASELLKKIRAEKDRLIAEGKIKRDKPLAEIAEEEKPFDLPVGWAWVRLSALAEFENGDRGSNYPSRSNFVDQGIAFINAGHLVDEQIDYADMNYITPQNFDLLRSGKIQRGDILYCLRGSLGKFAQVTDDAEGAIASSLVIIRLTDKAITSYVMRYLKSQLAEKLIKRFDNGTAQPNLGAGDLAKFVVPLPPLAEQTRIVTRVEELMQVCDALETSGQLEAKQHAQLVSTLLGTLTQSETPEALADNWQRIATYFDVLLDRPEAVDALEQTILQLAVRGLLVPQDPTDEPASVLLQKIRTEKDHLLAQGKIKRDKPLPPIDKETQPCGLPSGWTWVRLSELGEFGGGKTPSTQKEAFWDGDIPWITPKDMKQLRLASSEDRVTQTAVDDGLALIPPNSLLMVVRSGILRRTVPTAINEVATTINQDLKALVLVSPEQADYIQLLIRGFEGFILKNLTKVGTTVESIQFDAFIAQAFPLPPLAEQFRILGRVNELRGLCADLRQRLTASRAVQSHLADALVAG
jgi:type I restriction enzyme S subunit